MGLWVSKTFPGLDGSLWHWTFICVYNLPEVYRGSCLCCSVAKLCLPLRGPMDCSTPGFPDLHQHPKLLRLMSIELVMPSNHLIFRHSLSSCPQSFPASGLPMSRLFASSSQSIGASASASVLPMDTEGWFPLGWTALISLQSKRHSRIFSSTTVQSISSSALSLLYGPTQICRWLLGKNHSSDCTDQLSTKIPTVQFK